MKDTLHIPTLVQWLKDLSSIKSPTNYQLEEAWQIAQTLHGCRHPEDQRHLDDARRDIMHYLSQSDNEWTKPAQFDPHRHMLVPTSKRFRSWTEIDLTPELSWSILLAGRTIPNKLVKSLRAALGKQHANLKLLLHNKVN